MHENMRPHSAVVEHKAAGSDLREEGLGQNYELQVLRSKHVPSTEVAGLDTGRTYTHLTGSSMYLNSPSQNSSTACNDKNSIQ